MSVPSKLGHNRINVPWGHGQQHGRDDGRGEAAAELQRGKRCLKDIIGQKIGDFFQKSNTSSYLQSVPDIVLSASQV